MRRLMVALMFVMLIVSITLGTPYVDPEQLQLEFEQRMLNVEIGPQDFSGQRDIRSVADSVLTVEYLQLLDWLTTMQELNPGPDYGGQHEGETTSWNVIQTDNTQEALRDWSHYARVTGDLERYQVNVDAAWEYILNFPAYLEEGGGNPNYYRVHNCGWAVVAAIEYTEAYGDNETYLAYADSCARYLDQWRLSLNDALNPLAASFGAGALHTYALWRENDEWEQAAEEIATGVKQWIEADPERLNYNETWAMSAGTAMWGVITALFLDDPAAGQAWLPTYLPYMDTYSGPGSWNNSWTVWYGFAWNRAHQVLETQETLDNAIEVADYILLEAERDDDAGVPGTEGGNFHLDDQSWTSAYQVWYELEQLLHLNPLGEDAVAVGIAGLQESWPLIQGVEISLFAQIANAGLFPSYPDQMLASLVFTAPGHTSTIDDIPVPFGTIVNQSVGSWTPDQIGQALVTITVDSPGDIDPNNNYLERTYDVVPARVISGVVADSLSDDPLQGSIYWTQLDIEPVRSGVVEVDELTGEYSFIVASGQYSLISIPDVTPYPPRAVQVVVTDSDLPNTDFLIPPSRVMVVSGNVEASTDSLLMDAFAANEYDTFLWRIDECGMPGSEIQAEALDMLVWSFPQGTDISFDQDEWAEVQIFLSDITDRNGVIFNGDGMMQALNAAQKSELGIQDGEVDVIAQIIAGQDGSPFLTSDSLLIAGILWQQDVDEVISGSEYASPVGEFIPFGYLAGQALDPDDGVETVVLGFGMEGINDLDGRFVSRADFVGRIISWFGLATGISEGGGSRVELPLDFSLSAYPNPFNASLRIQVYTSDQSDLLLFDILGREVFRWTVGGSATLLFNAHEVASGMYFLRLDSGSSVIVQKVMLLR